MARETGKRRPGGVIQPPRPTPSPRRRHATTTLNTPAEGLLPVSGEVLPASDEELDEGDSFPIIVGVGASAGGLEALTELLNHLPGDTGLAFVLIQHLDPNHESHLTELLSKATRMPVLEVKDGTRAEANHVYVIAPKRNLGISNGVLETPPRPESGRNMPVDAFFRALAADRGGNALGVILSGTASDGTLGLQAIKAAGGITFAQDVQTAKYGGMPGSAIAAEVVDFVLPPAGIARQLAAFARDARIPGDSRKAPEQSDEAELARMLRLVRTTTGVDFAHYKHNTLVRRIRRRMALRGFEKLEDYRRDLERNRDEVKILCESFFVTVTAFFREPAVFDELKRRVFPALVANREPGDPIRIWVAGCSTGEEAYSVAICLAEFLEEAGLSVSCEVFATDISEAAITKARAGTYPDATLSNVSPERLAKFLHQNGSRLADREGDPRHLRFCRAQRGAGSAVFQTGPHLLLQRTDLPGRGIAAQGFVDSALRPEARGLPAIGSVGEHRYAFRGVSSDGEEPQNLSPAAGRERARAAAARWPAPRKDGWTSGRELPRTVAGWTCRRKPTGWCWPNMAPRAPSSTRI